MDASLLEGDLRKRSLNLYYIKVGAIKAYACICVKPRGLNIIFNVKEGQFMKWLIRKVTYTKVGAIKSYIYIYVIGGSYLHRRYFVKLKG